MSLNVAFLNLPYAFPLTRRYMCSYRSPIFMLPPHELLQLATCAREWNGAEVRFLDAIAEERTEPEVLEFLDRQPPDVLVSLTGVESFSDDLACLDRLKTAFPQTTVMVFGFYPTVFARVILEKSGVDFVLRGEPVLPLHHYLRERVSGAPIHGVQGLAGRDSHGNVFVNPENRIENIDDLPFPDYSLVDMGRYKEAFIGGPCGGIMAAHGCPFRCSYCATTYGHRAVTKSPARVVEEMEALVEAGARIIHNFDDTFCANRPWVIDVCKRLVDKGFSVPWVCSSRVDTLDADMLAWMRRAGCVRMLVGVESYSQRVLDYLNKETDPTTFNRQLKLLRDAGIETLGTFLVGAPVETEEDFQETLRGVRHAPLDLVGINILTPYADTAYFDKVKDDIVFSAIPYECRFKDPSIILTAMERERRLYRAFYFRPLTILRQLRRFLRYPIACISLLYMLLIYRGRQPRGEGRPDLF